MNTITRIITQELRETRLFYTPPAITRETTFREDLGCDMVDIWSIACDIEEQLGVSLPEREVERLQTVGELVDLVVAQGVCA